MFPHIFQVQFQNVTSILTGLVVFCILSHFWMILWSLLLEYTSIFRHIHGHLFIFLPWDPQTLGSCLTETTPKSIHFASVKVWFVYISLKVDQYWFPCFQLCYCTKRYQALLMIHNSVNNCRKTGSCLSYFSYPWETIFDTHNSKE